MFAFLDTEFTRLHDPSLISIGLVTQNGEEFYAEVPFPQIECSEFVRDIVMPLLRREEHAVCKDDYELRTRLLTWLTLVKPRTTLQICYEAAEDWTLLTAVLGVVPAFVQGKHLYSNEVNELMRWDFFQRSGLPEHHALYDARALRAAFFPRQR